MYVLCYSYVLCICMYVMFIDMMCLVFIWVLGVISCMYVCVLYVYNYHYEYYVCIGHVCVLMYIIMY